MDNSFVFLSIITFAFGACIGSFLNVCIYRIPAGKSIVSPGSSCRGCGTPIPFYFNIPVLSWLLLGGRCRFCKIKISIRYLIVELLTAFTAFFLFLKYGAGPISLYYFIFICILITISFIDFDHRIIPDLLSFPGIIICTSSFYFIPEMGLKNAIAGIFIGGMSFYTIAFLYYFVRKREGLGGGDIKLLAMIGAATGIKGVLFTLFSGSLLGTVFGAAAIFRLKTIRKNGLDDPVSKLKIPFGPFLSAGAVLYIFYGDQLIYWYLNII